MQRKITVQDASHSAQPNPWMDATHAHFCVSVLRQRDQNFPLTFRCNFLQRLCDGNWLFSWTSTEAVAISSAARMHNANKPM